MPFFAHLRLLRFLVVCNETGHKTKITSFYKVIFKISIFFVKKRPISKFEITCNYGKSADGLCSKKIVLLFYRNLKKKIASQMTNCIGVS